MSEVLIVIPPDRGWAWLVMICGFFVMLVVDGIIFIFGMFLKDLMNYYKQKSSVMGIANSVLAFMYFFTAPAVCAIASIIGYRKIMLVGCLISTVSLVGSTFMPHFVLFILLYGFFTGLGFGIMYVTPVVVVGEYFDRWRAVATAFITAGSAAGCIVIPLIFELVLDFTWQQKIWIESSLVLLAGISGLTFKPIKPTAIPSEEYNPTNTHYTLYEHKTIPEALKGIIDSSLLKSPSFLILLLSGFMTAYGLFTPFIFINHYAAAINLSNSSAKYLLPSIGAANTFGRLISGPMTMIPHLNALRLSIITMILCGISVIFIPFCRIPVTIYSSIICFGLNISTAASIKPIVVVDLLGLHKLGSGYAWILLTQSFGCLISVPTNAFLHEKTGGFLTPFIASGVSLILSGLLMAPVQRMRQCEMDKMKSGNK